MIPCVQTRRRLVRHRRRRPAGETARGESFPEALSYFPAAIDCGTGPHEYLETIRRTREAVAVPVIASLNGASRSGWHDYAKLVEEAGASAIELNLYFVPSDLCLTGPEVEAFISMP